MPTLKFLTRLAPALTLALIIAAITACAAAAPPTPTAPPTAATPGLTAAAPPETISNEAAPLAKTAPQIALSNAAGETVTLNDYRGRQNIVLIFYRGFW